MLPYILAAVGGYLIGDSLKGKYMAKGGDTDGDYEFDKDQQAKAEELYDKGYDLFCQGKTKDAESLRQQALKVGSWLGWTETDLPKYSMKGKQYADGGGYMAKGGKIDYSKQTSDDFKLGEIVWDIDNKRYGTIIGIYDKFEVRLDTDGMQPTENLRKLGCEGDKGTKEQLKEEIDGYARLVKSYPKNNYPKQLDSKMSDGGYMEGGGEVKDIKGNVLAKKIKNGKRKNDGKSVSLVQKNDGSYGILTGKMIYSYDNKSDADKEYNYLTTGEGSGVIFEMAQGGYMEGSGDTSRKGTYTGRIVSTQSGERMIGKISGYRGNGEPVYDVHNFGSLRKDMREKVGELANSKIKELLKARH
jgi:hypothetical protein